MLSDPNEYDIALSRTNLYRQNMSGLLTVYHVDGVDALRMSFNSPFKAAESLADEIAEPVQLVIGSYLLGNIFHLRLPSNFSPREDYVTDRLLNSFKLPPEGIWFPAYNHGYDEETWEKAGRMVTRREVENDSLLSGAPNREPLYILDVSWGCRDEAEKRLIELQKKTGHEIVAPFNDIILCSVPPRFNPERRTKCTPEVYARTLNRFSGGLSKFSGCSTLYIL